MVNKLCKKIMKDLDKSVLKNKWVVRAYKDVTTHVCYMTDSKSRVFYLELFHEGIQYCVLSTTEGWASLWREEERLEIHQLDYRYTSAYDLFKMLTKEALEHCLCK